MTFWADGANGVNGPGVLASVRARLPESISLLAIARQKGFGAIKW